MSFPKYPKYKPSGVEWLGEVPEHWEVVSLRHLMLLLTEKSDRRRNPLGLENVESWTGRFVSTDTEFEGDGVEFELGDILFGKLRPYLAKVYLANGPGEAVGDFHVMRPHREFIGQFAQYCLLCREFIAIVDGSTFGSKMPRASWEFVSAMKTTVPPRAEQTAIASFLDAETSKIDALIAEQRRLIELLKEKRQAVISHAVTKGLNPNAPMKPSGIEWLGDVPEHWDIQRIKHVIRSVEQGWSPQCENDPVQSDDQWGVLKVGCVNYGKFSPDENKALPKELQPEPALSIRKGDLLISRANTVELVGSAAVAEEDYPNLMLCDKLYRLRLDEQRVLPEFLCHFLTCEVAREPIELGASGASSSMKNIAQSVILEMWFASPNINEQREVIAAIGERRKAISDLIAEAERAIELLQERRTALISAVVTGKIDVREFANVEAA